MFYYFKDKHKLLEVKLEYEGHNYIFNSYEMELYSAASSYMGKYLRISSYIRKPFLIYDFAIAPL